jgi:hypothetical protein
MINGNAISKGFKWTGRIISLPVTALVFLFSLEETIHAARVEGFSDVIGTGAFGGLLFMVLVLFGGGISWWRLLPAGIILILAYFFFGISLGLTALRHAGEFQFLGFRDILGVISLISGLLFIISWLFSRRRRSETKTKSNLASK